MSELRVQVRDKISDALLTSEPIVPGTRLRDWLAAHIDDFEDRPNPPISITINDVLVLQAGWDHVVDVNDKVIIYPEPKAPVVGLIIKAVVTAAISYAISALTAPKVNNNYASSVPQGSSIYSANAQGNRPRLNGIIPEIFGRHKYYPDVITAPWREYIANDQWIHLTLSVGVGEYDIEDIKIGNTPIDRYAGDIESYIYAPSAVVHADAQRHIYTSLEVGNTSGGAAGIELENDGAIAYYGPFLACPINETVPEIQVDFVYQGLGELNSSNALVNKTVTLVVEWKDINATTWNSQLVTKTAKTTDQLGDTIVIPMGSMITPEVRVYRSTGNSTSSQVYDTVSWTSLRSHISNKDTASYDDITTMYLKIRGTNAIAGSAENKINMVVTRKLPTYTPDGFGGGSWSVGNVPTQRISAVFAYMCRDSGHVDAKIAIDTLEALEQEWEFYGQTFNGVFDSESTLFESLKRALATGYAMPTIRDGRIDLVRESKHLAYDQMFTPDNTLSISESGTLLDPDEPDGVQVEYFSEDTWKPEIIECLYGSDAGIQMEEVRAFGITNALEAWRFGMRVRRSRALIRRTWEIETELEGLNCEIGSMALISGRGGQYGWITDYAGNTSGTSMWLKTNVPLVWESGVTHYVSLRRPDGTAVYRDIASDPGTSGNYDIRLNLGQLPDFNPIIDGSMDNTLFQFGTIDTLNHEAIVKTVTPQGDTVRLELAEYHDGLYDDDTNSPP